MKVWVVMGNDYPDSVYKTENAAATFINAKNEEREKADRKKRRLGSGSGGYGRIYWRSYEFEIQK